MTHTEPTRAAGRSLARDRGHLGQIVLVFQGGGALGAYQAGVYQALSEHGVEPDWVIGTSIGAINAALIAGNAPEIRLSRLRAFWDGVGHGPLAHLASMMPFVGGRMAGALTAMAGLRGFFELNPWAWLGPDAAVGAENAGIYRVGALERTLRDLIDLDQLNAGGPRLSMGAAKVATAEMHYFDSRRDRLTLDHVLASCALPPAFPAVRIGDELFWDGGVLSNTPVEAVFDDNPRRNGLIFSVHLWNPQGEEPDSLWHVLRRQKELQYASRANTHIARQRQIHTLRHVIAELTERLPPGERQDPDVARLAAYGCVTRMHVVRLLAPPLLGESHLKDIDFSASGIEVRWQAGFDDMKASLEAAPWQGSFDPLDGFILHEGTVTLEAVTA